MEHVKTLAIIYAIIYFIIAFTTLELNPANWGTFTRFILAVLPIILFAMSIHEEKQKDYANNN